MLLIRAVGLLVVVAGLILVGISGDNHRVANGRRIAYGALVMACGVVMTLFGGELSLMVGWMRS